MTADTAPLSLKTLLGTYPQTRALKQGAVASPRVRLDYVEYKSAFEGFKPLVREQAFDVGELAIVTYLQAKAFGKPYVLLPAVVHGRSQHPMIVYNAARGPLGPADLPGRRVGVRAYTQTTGTWLRGILREDHGVDTDRVRWITFEEGHLAEHRDPPCVERAPPGKALVDMLLAGEVDAAIVAQLPDDPRLKPLIPDPEEAARAWSRRHDAAPINHMVVVRTALSQTQPDVVREIFRLLLDSKRAAGVPPAGRDPLPFGVEASRKALDIVIGYAAQQGLIPRRFAVDELFDDTTRALGG